MSLKVFTLNIESNKHFHRWPPVVPAEQPDVVCLQEIFAEDMACVEDTLGMSGRFFPMLDVSQPNRYTIPVKGLWGVGFFTNLPIREPLLMSAAEAAAFPTKADGGVTAWYYAKTPTVQTFVDPNDASRLLAVGTVEKAGVSYTIGTTHFTWSGDGKANEEQRHDLKRLQKVVRQFPDIVFGGDFNAPRGEEIFTQLASEFTDNLPPEVTTTIDLELHYAAPLYLAVDTWFSTPQYQVSAVRAISGLSDHIGVVATIERVAGSSHI